MRLAVVGALVLGGCQIIPGTDAAAIKEAERFAADKMRDPDSVKFRKMKLAGSDGSICGEMNGKNGYGAYAGYQRFVVEGSHVFMDPQLTLTAGDVRLAKADCIVAEIEAKSRYGYGANPERDCAVAKKSELEYELQGEFEKSWTKCMGLPEPDIEPVDATPEQLAARNGEDIEATRRVVEAGIAEQGKITPK